MAQPPNHSPFQLQTLGEWTPNTGFSQPSTPTKYETPANPVPNHPMLLGIDFAHFDTSVSPYVVFTHLPKRTPANPIAAAYTQAEPLVIAPQDLLIFEVYIQGASGPATFTTGVLDTQDVEHIGPYLSAGSYLTFRAHVSSPNHVNGTLVAKIYLQKGVSA